MPRRSRRYFCHTITAAPLLLPRRPPRPDSDDEPLSTPPADGLPNEEEGPAPGEDEARPRPVGATATGRRTDRRARTALLGTPARAAQSASPRPAAVEAARHGGPTSGSRQGHARGSCSCCCRCARSRHPPLMPHSPRRTRQHCSSRRCGSFRRVDERVAPPRSERRGRPRRPPLSGGRGTRCATRVRAIRALHQRGYCRRGAAAAAG